MEFRTPPISPLRQRMLEDMRMRKFQPHTQTGYIRAVLRLTHSLERSPDTATADDLRRFQVHLADDGATPSTINATLSGLKFFFEVTVGQGEVMTKVAPVRLPSAWMADLLVRVRGDRGGQRQAALEGELGSGHGAPSLRGLDHHLAGPVDADLEHARGVELGAQGLEELHDRRGVAAPGVGGFTACNGVQQRGRAHRCTALSSYTDEKSTSRAT
jgi:hypothetical protein